MDKRTFLKTSSAFLAGSLLAPLVSCRSGRNAVPRVNWAGNLTYSTSRVHVPDTVAQAQEIIRNSDGIRALGSRHCFNAIADSTIEQISLENLKNVVELDEAASQVVVQGGILYGELCPFLHERGYALHNLASLPHISIAGACATATHGSGVSNGNLATAVTAMEFIDANGELVTLSRDEHGEEFAGAVVGLGGLGVVTQLALSVEPTFDMAQHVYLGLPLASMQENFDEIMESGYSVSLFTDWQTDEATQVWIKRKADADATQIEPAFFGAALADRNVHPILALSAVNCTEQMAVAGPWFERLPHFRMDFTPSSGRELQTEFFVPREHAREAIGVLWEMGSRFSELLMISELRTIAADDLWMSTCYGRESVAIHFTWEQDWQALQVLLPALEDALAPFEARPHWGKLFATTPDELHSRYERIQDFRDLLGRYDPEGKFRNDFLDLYI